MADRMKRVELKLSTCLPPRRARVPQTTNLQTLWSLKYSIDAECVCAKPPAAAQLASAQQKSNECECNCGSVVLFGRSSWSPSVWWIIVVWCQQTAASSQSSVSLEPDRPPPSTAPSWGLVCSVGHVAWREAQGQSADPAAVWRANIWVCEHDACCCIQCTIFLSVPPLRTLSRMI